MSSDKYFIFKTSTTPPSYIGHDMKPGDDGSRGKLYGIKFEDMPEGNVLYSGKDKNGSDLIIIDNTNVDIKSIPEFDQNYKSVVTGVKLVMTSNNFSDCAGNVIKNEQSGQSLMDKHSDEFDLSEKPSKSKTSKPKKKEKVFHKRYYDAF